MSGKNLSATWLQYTFKSSNLTCYHTEFVNSGEVLLPPLCKLTELLELPCRIPGVCRNSWRAPGSTGKPMGWKSEIIHHTTEACLFCKQMCWLRRAACHHPSVVTVPTVGRTAGLSWHWLRQREPGQCNAQTNNSLQGLSDKISAWCY